MKRRYLIFFDTDTASGNFELSLKYKIKTAVHLREIENTVSKEFQKQISITNYKFTGFVWK